MVQDYFPAFHACSVSSFHFQLLKEGDVRVRHKTQKKGLFGSKKKSDKQESTVVSPF